jgi:acyl-CoA reductase-like NAD-dependent aldehyde dehydrogenase
MSEYTMSIDGEQQSAAQTFDVINPATEETLGRAPECSDAQLEAALQGAQRAFGSWRKDEDARRKLLLTAAERLAAKAPEIARTLTQEQGKPLAQAQAELQTAVLALKGAAAMPIPYEVTQDDAKAKIEVTHRPFGVVAAITPWNFPVMIAVTKIAPALLAGNTVVLKPSPYTPLATLQLGQLLNEVLPKGVLNVVSGGNALGAKLTSHALVRKISFTGSVATGLKVAEVAARDLKRTTLELGGNDPAIVLPDADIERFATRLFWSSFFNCGQICLAVKRVYVAEPLLEPLLAALTKLAQGVQLGDGLEPTTQVGPMNNLMQLERVIELTEDAKKHGAKVHAGGERLGRKGYFYPPTILSHVDDKTRVVAEEQFGPVLPLLSYRTVDEVIERANATKFGLGASVWGTDVERATELAKQIDAGTVWVNQHVSLTHKAPFTGAKSSGIGLASGRWGLESYLQTHVINISRV